MMNWLLALQKGWWEWFQQSILGKVPSLKMKLFRPRNKCYPPEESLGCWFLGCQVFTPVLFEGPEIGVSRWCFHSFGDIGSLWVTKTHPRTPDTQRNHQTKRSPRCVAWVASVATLLHRVANISWADVFAVDQMPRCGMGLSLTWRIIPGLVSG